MTPSRVLGRAVPAVVLALVLVLVPAAGGAAPGAAPAPGPLPVPAGAFDWPLDGVGAGPPTDGTQVGAVGRRFRTPPHPYGPGHRGADLVAPPGAPVLAAGAGTVVFAGPVAGRGVVSVEHAGSLRTTYEPVVPAVAVGTPVARGDRLGTLTAGHRGCPVVACLHWGLRRPAPPGSAHRLEYLDPLLLLRLGEVRLLPSAP